jgi:alcohol dehydrogenase class IV
MALAALLSGVTLTSAGLGAVHGFAAPLGANYPVPHGVVCAALLPPVVEANVRALSANADGATALAKYATLGRALRGDGHGSADDVAAFAASLARELRIPRLSSFGLTRDRAPEMVTLARKASSMRFNPVPLTDEALVGILERAL